MSNRNETTRRRHGLRVGAAVLAAAACVGIGPPGFAHEGHDHAPPPAAKEYDGSGASRWGANFFPNVTLTTQDGEQVRFFDDLVKDKVVLINLIYTRCKDSCPLATAQLRKVQQILGDRLGHDIFMYSITIDPTHDTPEVLKKYTEKFHVGPGWLFLTGSPDDIMKLRVKLGFHFQGMRDDLKDHNGAVLIGNQSTGQWVKRSLMDSPYQLAEVVGTWFTNWKLPSRIAATNYAAAPKLQLPTMGENLFRSRCTVCHTIGSGSRVVGGGEEIEKNQVRAGPDLLGVTEKRSQAWLARWLTDPGKMLEEEDPVAVELYKDYDEVIMPNFRLSEVEVHALIEFIASESRRVKEAAVADVGGK